MSRRALLLAGFASPDQNRGRQLFLSFAAFHTVGAGDGHGGGPNLHGVFGRR